MDGQRPTAPREDSVKDRSNNLTSVTTAREDTIGRPGDVKEDSSFPGPSGKSAQMSSSEIGRGFRLGENQATNVREQLQRHPNVSTRSKDDTSGLDWRSPSRYQPSSLRGFFSNKGFISSSKTKPHGRSGRSDYRYWLSRTECPQDSSSTGLRRYLPMDPMFHIYRLEAALSESSVTPPSTVAKIKGQSTGQRISLRDCSRYDDFAEAMKIMFNYILKGDVSSEEPVPDGENCTLMNAIPGYVIVYVNEKGGVRPAGDIPWRNFVRTVKQIKIVSDIII